MDKAGASLAVSPKTITARIGPIEQSAIKPKLLSLSRLSPSAAATPTPSDIIKGTVIGPVVTPPESKARGINLVKASGEMVKPKHTSANNNK